MASAMLAARRLERGRSGAAVVDGAAAAGGVVGEGSAGAGEGVWAWRSPAMARIHEEARRRREIFMVR